MSHPKLFAAMHTTGSTTAALVLPLGLFLAALPGCSEPAASDAGTSSQISQDALLERLDSEDTPVILDVRTPQEFDTGHVPGAINVPHTQLDARLDDLDIPQGAEVVVYCERGGRAQRAISVLDQAGYSRARHLEGDMSSWRGADLPCTGC